MALNLSVVLGKCRLIPGDEGSAYPDVFQPIPEAKVVVEGLCRRNSSLLYTPFALLQVPNSQQHNHL